jgi:hypothetical protein
VFGERRTIRVVPIAILPFLVVVIAGIARDVVRPYHSEADVIVREVFSDLSRRSVPGDRWLVYASRDDSGFAPRYSAFVGMGGRIDFQIRNHAPGPVLWAPDPASVTADAGGRTWLIAYGNRVFEPDPANLEAYVAHLAETLRTSPALERHELADGEWIDLIELGQP